MAVMVFISAMRSPEVFRRDSTGTITRTPGSSLNVICNGYANFVEDQIGFVSNSILGDGLCMGIRALVWFLPQLLAATVGGLLTRLIFRQWWKRHADIPLQLCQV
jgi:hypothetical protein